MRNCETMIKQSKMNYKMHISLMSSHISIKEQETKVLLSLSSFIHLYHHSLMYFDEKKGSNKGTTHQSKNKHKE